MPQYEFVETSGKGQMIEHGIVRGVPKIAMRRMQRAATPTKTHDYVIDNCEVRLQFRPCKATCETGL